MQSHGEDGEWPWIPLKAPNCWPPFFCILAGVPPRAANPPLQSRSAWTSHTHTGGGSGGRGYPSVGSAVVVTTTVAGGDILSSLTVGGRFPKSLTFGSNLVDLVENSISLCGNTRHYWSPPN